MLLLSGSGVVTVVNTTTSAAVYTSPYYLSGTVTGGLLTTNSEVVLFGTSSSGCGPFSGRHCSPGYVTSINLADGTTRAQFNISDKLGPVVFDPQVGITYTVHGGAGDTGFLVGLSLDYGSTITFNVSTPYNFNQGATSNSLAVRCVAGIGHTWNGSVNCCFFWCYRRFDLHRIPSHLSSPVSWLCSHTLGSLSRSTPLRSTS